MEHPSSPQLRASVGESAPFLSPNLLHLLSENRGAYRVQLTMTEVILSHMPTAFLLKAFDSPGGIAQWVTVLAL